MRQSRSSYLGTIVIFAFALALAACGGGNNSSGGGSTTYNLVLTPTAPPSLNYGQVSPVVATLQDADGNTQVSGKITWTSSNTSLLTVSATGGQCGDQLNSTNTTCLCAGTWDANIINCTPATTSGTATLTATDGTHNVTTTVYVHPRIARVVIGTTEPGCAQNTPSTPDCTSSTGTLQLQAKGCDAHGNEITVGPTDGSAFTWSTQSSDVVTSSAKGLYTAVNPGVSNVYASLNSVVSLPLSFATCAVKQINLHLSGGTDTSFTGDSGATKTVAADVIDSKDKTITIANSRLAFASANNGIVGVSSAGSVSTTGAGSSAIIASCAPPSCNSGFYPIYSNPVVANVNGTSSTQVIVASKDSTSLYPIDATAGTVGTAVTLPAKPNSIIFARTGLGAYLGSATDLIAYDNTTGAGVPIGSLPGKVLALSNQAGELVLFDASTATNNVRLLSYNGQFATTVVALSVPAISDTCETTHQCPRASFAPDNQTAYIVAGTNLFVLSQNFAPKTVPLSAIPNDVAVTEQGSFAFVAMPNNTVDVYATCNNNMLPANSVGVPAVPQRLVPSMDGTKVYVATPPSLSAITVNSDFLGCPPALTNPVSTYDLGQGTFNTKQMLITSNGAKVAILTDDKVIIFNTVDNTATPVTLSGGATPTTGDVTLDGKTLWVGGSDSKVHKIDLTAATPADTQQVTVTVSPDLVAVKTK